MEQEGASNPLRLLITHEVTAVIVAAIPAASSILQVVVEQAEVPV